MSKYNQLESSKYKNNEYANMPSIDYGTSRDEICPQNIDNGCDWDKVKAICEKHGFGVKFVYPTFCKNGRVEVIIYYKSSINEDEYTCLSKSKERAKYWELMHTLDDKLFALHDCIHELDEETNLYFSCGWQGNSGLFGNHDVSRKTYSNAAYPTTYRELCNWLSPSIHDTSRKFSKGVYVMTHTHFFKINEKMSFPEFTNEMAIEVMKSHNPDLNYKVCMGRRACDGPSEYEAIVVTDKNGCQYGSFTFAKDCHDIVGMCYRSILGGETGTSISRETYIDDIKHALKFMAG